MPILSFNLGKTIAAYNKERNCNYAPDEDFGFAYFEKGMLAQTNATITVVNTGIDRYHFTPEERAFLKKRKQYYQRYQFHLSDGVEIPVRVSMDEDSTAWEFQQKMQFWNWTNAWVAQLSKPETWQAWFNTIPSHHKTQMLKLKQQWEKMTPFVYHTHTSVHVIATELLPQLIEHHKEARRQLVWSFWQLPSDIWVVYKNYLDNFLQDAEKTKSALATTTLLRLKAWDKNRLTEGNPLIDLHHELQKISVIPKKENPPLSPETLTVKQFHDFHQYIEQHGDESTKKELKTLSWISKGNSTCSTRYVVTPTDAWLIPEEFVKDVPLTLRKPAWLHRGHNLRYTFFKTKGPLFVSLKTFPDIQELTLSLQDLSAVSQVLTDLNHKQYNIEQALNELEDPAYQELGRFQSHTKQFIQQWQNYLVNYQYKVIENKLQIAEKIAAQLQLCDPVDATFHAWSACSFMSKFIKILRNELKDHPHEALQQRLVYVEKRLVSTLSNYRILQLIHKVAGGKVISQEKLDYVLDVAKTIRLANKKMYVHFQEICQPQFNKMRQLLDYELKANVRELNDPQFHADRILLLNKVLDQCGDESMRQENKQRIANKLPKYFLKYLETLLRCDKTGENFAHHQKAILAFEQVIFGLDTGLLFANKTLSTHVKDLQKLREDAFNKNGSWVLVHARCQALAQGLLSVYLEKRVKKDLATFDRLLFDFIKADSELHFNETTVSVLQRISDQYIEQPVTAMQELSLTPEQKTITGLNGGSSSYILELLELRKQAYLQQRHILMTSHSLKEKSQLVKTMATDLKQGLQKNPKPSLYAFMGYTASGRRELFTKTYFDTQLLSAENKSNTLESTLFLTKQ